MLEEAKKRDHRKLGRELELFVLDDDVGPGLPMWLPRGGAIIDELEKLARETEFAAGYQRVRTPHIARESLYLKSGHLPYYEESMFPEMELFLGGTIQRQMVRLREKVEEKDRRFAKILFPDLAELVEQTDGPEVFLTTVRDRVQPLNESTRAHRERDAALKEICDLALA